MIVNLQSQNINISRFEVAVDFFKSTLTDASEFLLKKITENVNMQNKKLKENYAHYEKNPNLLLDENMALEYDRMFEATDIYNILRKEAEEYKDMSPAFMDLYNAIETYYTTLVVVSTDLGFLEAELMYEKSKIKNAS